KEKLKSNHDFDDDRFEDATTKNYRPAYYKNNDYQILICHVIDQETFEAHAVNVCVMQDVIITVHNSSLTQFVDIARIIKYNIDDLEIDMALHILLKTIDRNFDIVTALGGEGVTN